MTTTDRVHRIETRLRDPSRPEDATGDPSARAARQAMLGGLASTSRPGQDGPDAVAFARVYFIEGPIDDEQARRVAEEVLADPVIESAVVGIAPSPLGDAAATVEVHPLPGVMDPDAAAVETAVRALLGVACRVRTGRRYDVTGMDPAAAEALVAGTLANPVVHGVHGGPVPPAPAPVAQAHDASVPEVPLVELDDAALERLSRDAHLFLSLEEMRAIRDEYRRLGREPRAIELETLAQTWSEHCVHKTLKARIRYEGELPGDLDGPGRSRSEDGAAIVIDNLLASTVAAATHRLIADGADWCLSVFKDNAGIVAFDDETAVCFKVETHNHPSAIEPYGGAATGIGGCIRDIIGTGLAARPIAATDVFCVGPQEGWGDEPGDPHGPVPAGCLHPRRILRDVVGGVRDYGNRMGIPTLNGLVWFDPRYVGNPLVFCGCVGVMPRDLVEGEPAAGDRIIAIGGRTGRDGIHGATFSSAELTDTHVDEFAHAVQIGDPVTEKKALDAILEARDHEGGCLFRAITDCGAGGFSSAVGEMGEHLGAEVDLERAPLKYDGLSPVEIWISEAQERMVLAVPSDRVPQLAAVCERHDVEWCDLGVFGTDDRTLRLRFRGDEVGRLSMSFLHDGIPKIERRARWTPPAAIEPLADGPCRLGGDDDDRTLADALLELVAAPNIASKESIIRQYDHEVQGRTVLPPLVGVEADGPGDAAVIRPVRTSTRGLAIACGIATGLEADPYVMALAAVDECVRNLACVGADPERIAILDNFCWPGVADEASLGALVRAAVGCHDAAVAYGTPFISGKDSLNNQFKTDDGRVIRIPPTLLVSGFAPVPDVARAVTMDLKRPGRLLVAVGTTDSRLGGSEALRRGLIEGGDHRLAGVDLHAGPQAARAVAAAIRAGVVHAAHDCSEGGLLVAAAEMAMAGGLGLVVDLLELPRLGDPGPLAECFAETPSRYLLEVDRADLDDLDRHLGGVPWGVVGEVEDTTILQIAATGDEIDVEELRAAFTGHRPAVAGGAV